ncbi:MAG: hypothetical protein NTV31_04815 [Bacteroidia bacterium]|nr:hypothetical protein [Bacteroidia bacterium]
MKIPNNILLLALVAILSFLACVKFEVPEPIFNSPYDTASIDFNDELNGGDWHNLYNSETNIYHPKIIFNSSLCYLIGGIEDIDTTFKLSNRVVYYYINTYGNIILSDVDSMISRRVFSSAELIDDYLYIFGGDTLGTFEYAKLNQIQMNWIMGGSIPDDNMTFGSFSEKYTNKIIIGGGESPINKTSREKEKSDKVWLFDPVLNQWSILTTLPLSLSFATSQIIAENLYIIGGFDKFDLPLNVIYIYDINTDTWSNYPDTLTIARGKSVSTIRNDRVYIIGGVSYGEALIDAVDEMKLAKSVCIKKNPIHSIISVYGCYLNESNDIVLIGGDEIKGFRIFEFSLPY